MQSNKIELDEYGEKALMLLAKTNTSFFLTGNGGTGKSTLLKYYIEENLKLEEKLQKKVQILATTWAAAQLYEYGETYHSFFRIFGERLGNVTAEQKAVMKHFDIYIIDEASMISASQFDLIDKRLRQVTGIDELFGGKQVIFVGHLFQASPVVTQENKDEYEQVNGRKFDDVYDSIFFFDAEGFDAETFKIIELKKVHRTADLKLQTYLKNLMLGENLSAVCAYFNARYKEPSEVDHDKAIYIANTNSKVDKYNIEQLERLRMEEKQIVVNKAKWWNWDTDLYGRLTKEPSPVELSYCLGARIIFNKNTEYFKNGTMGEITNIETVFDQLNECEVDIVWVAVDGGSTIPVQQSTWNKYETHVEGKDDDGNDIVIREVIATYTQFPFQLGWALTGHKSQGKTFPKIIVDLGLVSYKEGNEWKKKAMEHIIYVGLSRATTYEGIQLVQRLRPEAIAVNQKVKEISAQLVK